MADVAPVDLPYLQIYRSRGKAYAYYRRDGRQVRIRAKIDSADFADAYAAARREWEGAPVGTRTPAAKEGSIRELVTAYRAAPEYRNLAPKTKRDYDRTLDIIVTRFGVGMVADADRAWVYRLRDELQDQPRSANYRLAIISRLMTFAVKRGRRPDNPAMGVDKLRTSGEGFRCWTGDELAAMTAPTAGDVALPVLIGRYTAQREGDVLRLPWSAYDGQTIALRQGKTGAELVLPVPAELKNALDAIKPRPGLLICLTSANRAWKPDWFRHRFAQVRAAAGLAADVHFHGLRATRLTELAENGASEAEIKATGGHKTSSMVARYTRQAEQKRLAKAAVARMPKRRKIVPTV